MREKSGPRSSSSTGRELFGIANPVSDEPPPHSIAEDYIKVTQHLPVYSEWIEFRCRGCYRKYHNKRRVCQVSNLPLNLNYFELLKVQFLDKIKSCESPSFIRSFYLLSIRSTAMQVKVN